MSINGRALARLRGPGFALWASPGRGRRKRKKIEEEGKELKRGGRVSEWKGGKGNKVEGRG